MGASKVLQRSNDSHGREQYDLFLFIRRCEIDPYYHWAFLKRTRGQMQVEIIYSWGAETVEEHIPNNENYVRLRNPLATIEVSSDSPVLSFDSLPHHDNNLTWMLHMLQQLRFNNFITTADFTEQAKAIQSFNQPILIRSRSPTSTQLERAGIHRASLFYLRSALSVLASRGLAVNDLTAVSLPPGTGLTGIRSSVTADIYVQWRLTANPHAPVPTVHIVLIPRDILYDTFVAHGWDDAMARAPPFTPDMDLSSITLGEEAAPAGGPGTAWSPPRREIHGPESPAKPTPLDQRNVFHGMLMVTMAAKMAAIALEGDREGKAQGNGRAGSNGAMKTARGRGGSSAGARGALQRENGSASTSAQGQPQLPVRAGRPAVRPAIRGRNGAVPRGGRGM